MAFTHFLPVTQIARFGTWLKSLDGETLRSYFGISLNHHGINLLVSKWKKDPSSHHFLVAHQEHQWAGVLHIATRDDSVEFGVIVKKEFRRHGIGNQLLSEAIVWAQNRGYQNLFMHCVNENQAIQKLCAKHNLITRNVYGDVEVEMKLPEPTWRSLFREGIQRQANWYSFMQKSFS
jgi:GNAT superfamily N-acetyltransferase